jgi:hypothetical protein
MGEGVLSIFDNLDRDTGRFSKECERLA